MYNFLFSKNSYGINKLWRICNSNQCKQQCWKIFITNVLVPFQVPQQQAKNQNRIRIFLALNWVSFPPTSGFSTVRQFLAVYFISTERDTQNRPLSAIALDRPHGTWINTDFSLYFFRTSSESELEFWLKCYFKTNTKNGNVDMEPKWVVKWNAV